MSRRPPNPSAERAAQNQQTLKTLVKLESNKSCADCKKNKHPRWASWNLGIFVCIRCSGIHRGMGTHISRVKSVDLDAWTDEQMQNMIRWGNARANKYWEAKLAPGHVPAEGKIDNFIRTKYDSKRWVMDGGMPDPSTLDVGGDDDMPLNVVQEKARLGHTERKPSTNVPPPQTQRANPDIDLFGDSVGPTAPTAKSIPVTTSSSNAPPIPPKTEPTLNKPAKTGESLLGFDFFGESQSTVPARPSSAASSITSTNAPSRPDLKQSILSLYSSNSRSTTPSQQPQQTGQVPAKSPPPQSSFSSLESDFSSLNFGSAPPAPRPSSNQPSVAFASPPSSSFSPPQQQSFGGSFFDSKPLSSTTATSASGTPGIGGRPAAQRGFSASSDFGGFESAASPGLAAPTSPGFQSSAQSNSNALGDMFNFADSSTVSQKAPTPTPAAASITNNSPFNISAPSQPAAQIPEPKPAPAANSAALMNMDPWGSSEAWSSSSTAPAAPAATPASPPPKAAPTLSTGADDWGWGGSGGNSSSVGGGFGSSGGKSTQITADEDFGGWESSTMASPTQPSNLSSASQQAPAPKPAGGFSSGGDDLFSNVWE